MINALKICIPHTLRDHFDYLDCGLNPPIGARVVVPFRQKNKIGVVIGKGQSALPHTSLKTIESVIDETPLLCESTLRLCQWVSAYYQSPLSEVLPLAIPKKYRVGDTQTLPKTTTIRLQISAEEAKMRIKPQAKKQQQLISWLAEKTAVTLTELKHAGFNHSQIKALLAVDVIRSEASIALPYLPTTKAEAPLTLNEEQRSALQAIAGKMDAYHCFLLQGITGSGKTEVYLQLIAECLQNQQQVLVLVPEIGLTPQLLARFQERFKEPMAVLHSGLNERERQTAWQMAKDNIAKLIIGTRTAVFTPMPNLALIIIDEEHDASLKQGDGVRYSARDTALMRAWQNNIAIVLGSATPSLESLHNALQNKYTRLRLTQKALTSNPLHITLCDLRAIPLEHGLAATTIQRIAEHIEQNHQVMVFINRRGYAPVLLCHQCGWMADCSACDSHMTLHAQKHRLICHHCGRSQRMPNHCQKCRSNELLPIGSGTQRIHEYLSGLFPQVNILRIDRDEVRGKSALERHLHSISQGEAQVIVGTQMLAKGHHFPRLTLAVIVDVDAGFYNQDFRALERLGQLLTQVSGRAGRAEHQGEVIIQTHLPQHPLLNILVQEGYDRFAQVLLESRQQAQLPPFQYLALLRVKDKKLPKILEFLHAVKDYLVDHSLQILGPAPSPLARKANEHHMQLLLKSPSRKKLQQTLTALRQWITMNKKNANIIWNIDVDPQDLS